MGAVLTAALISRSRLDKDGVSAFGFDMEWPVTYRSGAESRTALVQLSTSPTECFLFHISCMSGQLIAFALKAFSHQSVKANAR